MIKKLFIDKLMSQEQKSKYNMIFGECDLNGNGNLDKKEFTMALNYTNH